MQDNDQDIRKARRVTVLSVLLCIIWWISPLDDALEAFMGPFAISDEIIFTVVAFMQVIHLKAIQNTSDALNSVIDSHVQNGDVGNGLKNIGSAVIHSQRKGNPQHTGTSEIDSQPTKDLDNMSKF